MRLLLGLRLRTAPGNPPRPRLFSGGRRMTSSPSVRQSGSTSVTNWLADRDALLARLSAVEAERDHFQTIARQYATVQAQLAEAHDLQWAAEARVEAAEQALRNRVFVVVSPNEGPELYGPFTAKEAESQHALVPDGYYQKLSPFVPCDCADGFLWDPRVDGNIVPCPRCARAALSAGGEGGG